MTPTLPRTIFASVSFALLSLGALAQPVPVATPASNTSGPVPKSNAAPGLMPGASPLAPSFPLQGVISADEYAKYTAFQQQANNDPAITVINAKIAKLTKEIQQLRLEAQATREKLISANPEIKKIHDKLMTAMQPRPGGGPMPLPMPVPVSGSVKPK